MSTHFNFEEIIPDDLGLVPKINPASLPGRRKPGDEGPVYLHMKFGPLDLTIIDPDEADRIAAAFTEAARLLREAAAPLAEDGAR
jgi:hypothetical protein